MVSVNVADRTPDIQDQILTVEELASYLRLSTATIYRMAQTGEMPAKRVGRSWRFSQTLIDEWLRMHDNGKNDRSPV
ncbi:MAG: helix-turn-helix domain-containing protein [Anaerolineales bacterium]|nr:helix-turn-helix domain-containing protein [Anaerolineales bacterium]